MSRAAANPFSAKAVLAMLAIGALAFLAMLYAIGAGWNGGNDRNGGAHAASNSLNGFSALAEMLERRGHDVTLSRTPASADTNDLLVLTPPLYTDAEELIDLVEARRYSGPTLIILPKWMAYPLPDDERIEAERGWVELADAQSPGWFAPFMQDETLSLVIGKTRSWTGLGLAGPLPEPDSVQGIKDGEAPDVYPLVRDAEGDVLAGWLYDDGYYPDLAAASGEHFFEEDADRFDYDRWPVVVVFEPDLANNYGFADLARAKLAVQLVETALEYDGDFEGRGITFDLTLNGLGASENLLTLAFRPPFLAATLCLILAALLVAWRGFRRFGPPRTGVPELAHGKTQLAENGGSLLARAKRWHLLGPPFAAMVTARLARRLGIPARSNEARESAIDAALTRTGDDKQSFATAAQAMRAAHSPAELLRAGHELRKIETSATS